MAAVEDGPTVRLVAHCRRCHGWLLSARSVAAGIGPTCAIRERREQRVTESAAKASTPVLFELPVADAEDEQPRDLLDLLDLAS